MGLFEAEGGERFFGEGVSRLDANEKTMLGLGKLGELFEGVSEGGSGVFI